MGYDNGDVGGSLRKWASSSGDPQLAATVELVVRFGLADPTYPWIRRGVPDSRWPDDWVDFRTLKKAAERTPGMDGIVMNVAADFGRGVPVSPAVLGELDDDRRSYVLSAIAQRPAGEWPAARSSAPLIPVEVIEDITARERQGMDRLLRDMFSDVDHADGTDEPEDESRHPGE